MYGSNDLNEMNDKKLKKDKSVKAHDAATHLSTSHHGRSASSAPVAQSGLSPLTRTVIGWVLPVLGLVAIAVALLAYDSDFLFRVQELNLFLYTPLFFEQQMVVSGGFLTWLGTYFTQYFYHPWLGVALLSLWWMLLMWFTKRAFRLPAYASALLLVPVVMLLITVVDMGYWIFYLKLRGHVFAATIGTTVAVGLVWLYRVLSGRFQLRNLFMLLSTVVAYPLLGYYGLMATGLMALLAWRMGNGLRDQLLSKVVATIVAVVAIIFVPLVCYRYVYCQTPESGIYTTALPIYTFYGEHNSYYLPFELLTLVLALFALAYGSWRKTVRRSYVVLGNIAVLAILVVGAWMGWYKDNNFRRELIMTHAVEDLDWDKVLQTYQTLGENEEPTRMMWMLKNLALFRQGTAGDNMYHYKNGSAAPDAPFQVRLSQTGAKLIYYHYGKLNFCYRWCLEDGVEYGWCVDYLKYMLKGAVINGEAKLAEKYASALRHTLWYSHIADQYTGLIGNPSKVAADKEMRRILPLMRYGDVLDGDGGMIEVYLLNSYAYSSGGSREIVERALMNSLIMKNLDGFWPRFMSLLEGWKGHVPIHCQEAALMVAQLKGGVDVSALPIDDTVRQRFERLVELSAQNGDQASNAYMLRPEFGDTYWYYYFFVEGLKTN